jgi:hypothetical protein
LIWTPLLCTRRHRWYRWWRQFGDLIGVVGDIEIDVPFPVFAADGAGADGELGSFIGHIADVDQQVAAEIGAGRYGYGIQQVGGLFVVDIDGAPDAVVEESIIDTAVPGGCLFPFDVGVIGRPGEPCCNWYCRIGIGGIVADRVDGLVGILIDPILVARDAIADAEVQVGERVST